MSRGKSSPQMTSAQMRQGLQNLRIVPEESGATIRDVLKTTVYVTSSDRGEVSMRFGLTDGQPRTLDEIGRCTA